MEDVGFHGSDIKTPNIDKLAETGARLEQFYVQPMCTPTRAALLTGRYPFRYGLQTAVIPTPSKYGLATDERILPQALKEAGYSTVMVGKWHLGHSDRKYWPRQRGFDYHYGSMVGEVDYFTHASANVKDWFRNNKPVKETGYVTRLWGEDGGCSDKCSRSKDAVFPLPRIHGTARSIPGAEGIPRQIQAH
jgi:arylsulfatase A-like enzyme